LDRRISDSSKRPVGRRAADLIIRNIGQLLTLRVLPGRPGRPAGAGGGDAVAPDWLGLIEDAVVAVKNGCVLLAGPRTDVEPHLVEKPGTVVIDAAGGVVAPGLVDPHTHLLFAGWREAEFALRLEGRTYLEILASGGGILSSVARFRAASDEELLSWGRSALDRMLLSGTTTVEAKTGYGLDAAQELRALRLYRRLGAEHPVSVVPTFLGAHAVPAEYRNRPDAAAVYVDEVCLPLLAEIAGDGLAEFCDVFCEAGVFGVAESRRLLTEATRLGFGVRLHADEIEPTGGAELAAELGAVSADHLVRASDQGLAAMARAGVTAVLLPATTFTLGLKDYAPARKMLDLGLEVALATDFNPGTSPVESMPLVMGIACRALRLTPAETFRAVTVAAAKAVGLEGRAGQIQAGVPADLVVFEATDYRQVPYRLGTNLVRTVLKKGRIVVSEGRLRRRR
jgi:imidazolonepropionase